MLEQEVRLALSEERELEGLLAEGEVLSGLPLAGLELKHAQLRRCRFVACDFSGAVFDQVAWHSCDFSNCRFEDTVWSGVTLDGCKGEGGYFVASRWRDCTLIGSVFRCANFTRSRWRRSRAENCRFERAVLAEADISGLTPCRSDFLGADFFHTPLKGLDFSDCRLSGITVSESLRELRGMKLNPAQAVELMPLLGVELL